MIINQIIYFIYGLSFFTMGLAITIQIIQPSQLYLAKTLWLLAAFGFTHAVSEWGYIFVPLQAAGHEEYLLFLSSIHLLFMALSFAFLLAFGLSQYFRDKKYLFVPGAILLVWYINFVFYFDHNFISLWYVKSEIWARYLLGFPGALLSGLGLWKHYHELKSWGSKIGVFLRNASVILLIYSVLAGIIVPAGDVFPSNILNNENFFAVFHVPVQVARGALSILLSWYVLKLLSVFSLEYKNNMDKVQRLETLCKERQRIANDIHDGVIQAIYGSGMLLDRAEELIDKNPERSKKIIENVIVRLNESIDSLRRYIQGLKSEDFGQLEVEDRFEQIVKQYQEIFPEIEMNASIRVPIWFVILPGAVDHLIFILQEAIANAARHSSCTRIEINIVGDEQKFEIQIRDNGTGLGMNKTITPGMTGHGIGSMKQRAQLLNTKLDIQSNGQGTVLSLKITRRDHNDEKI